MKTAISGIAGCALLTLTALAATPRSGLREWSVSVEAPVRGRSMVTVRMTPSATREYDAIVFECTLRQEYTRTGSDGVARRRVMEPATFVYRETDARMVEDLDKHVSFRVPVGLEDVRAAYGETLFVDEAPVTISRIVIKAMKDGKVEWQVDSPPSGTHRPAGAPGAGDRPS